MLNIRKATESEIKYFKDNPKVEGMMSQDSDQVVLRPKEMSKLTPKERRGLAENENFRLFIRKNKPQLDFKLTDEQKENLSDTDYAKTGNDYQAKATILARIYTGDKSGGKATKEQTTLLNKLAKEMAK
jgi:hypothetical protein